MSNMNTTDVTTIVINQAECDDDVPETHNCDECDALCEDNNWFICGECSKCVCIPCDKKLNPIATGKCCYCISRGCDTVKDEKYYHAECDDDEEENDCADLDDDDEVIEVTYHPDGSETVRKYKE